MSLFEKVKNIRRNNLQEKRKFPGDESGAYKTMKADIDAKRGLRDAGASGDFSPTMPTDKRKKGQAKRDARIKKLDTPDPFTDKTKFTDKNFKKSFKDVEKAGKKFIGPRQTQTQVDKRLGKVTDPFKGSEITKGQANVKGLESKAFKKTQPKDIKLPKSFTDFERNLQDYKDRDLPGGPRKTTTKPKTPSQPKIGFGGTPGTKPPGGTKTVKQSEVSKQAKDFTQKINQKKTTNTAQKMSRIKGDPLQGNVDYDTSTKSTPKSTPKPKPQKSASAPDYTQKINQANKNRKEFAGNKKLFSNFAKEAETAKDKLRKDVDKIAKNPNLTGKQKATQARPVMKNVKIAQDFERGYKSNPKDAVVRTSDLDMIKKTTEPKIKKKKKSKNKSINKRVDAGTSKTKRGFRVTRGVGGGSQQKVTYGANDPDLSRMSAKDRATYQKIKDTTPKGGIPKWMKKFDKKYPIKSFKKAATPAAKAFSKAGPVGKLAAAALVAGGAVYGANQIRKAFAGAGKPKTLPTVKGSALRYTSGPKKGQKKYFDLKSFKTNRTFTKSDLKDAGFKYKADQNLQKRIISQNRLIKTANKK